MLVKDADERHMIDCICPCVPRVEYAFTTVDCAFTDWLLEVYCVDSLDEAALPAESEAIP